MPKASARTVTIRLNKIRVMLAEGRKNDYICEKLEIHPRTLNKYKNKIREEIIGDFDGKKVVDLWTAHKERMEKIIQECMDKLEQGADGDVSPDKLYRTIQSASESITDMGIKIGIVPPVAQKLSVDVTEKKEDDKLKELLTGYKSTIADETTTEPTEKTD
jgi:hypothetical protein